MNISTLLLSQLEKPSGLWSMLINWFHGGIGNFGWTVLLVTILVKLIVSPLEFMTKLSTKKQTLIQQKCAPQVAKIQKKFGKDTQSVRVQTNALYKREGLNTGAGCLFMIINMVISLTIFFTFYSSLNKNSAYQTINQFEQLSTVYTNKNYELLKNAEIVGYTITTDDDAKQFISDFNIGFKLDNLISDEKESEITLSEENITYYTNLYNNNKDVVQTITDESIKAVIEKWNSVKSSWLWIDNIWVSDSTIYPFPVYENFMQIANSGKYGTYIEDYAKNLQGETSEETVAPEDDVSAYQSTFEDYYNTIASIVNGKSGRKNNGYFILAILAAIITFLSQYLTELSTKLKNAKAKLVAQNTSNPSMQSSMKIMKIIMPIIMVVFVLQSSASFGIYIFASNIVAIITNQVSTIIINKITHKQQTEVEEFLEKEADRLIKKGKLQENK